MLFNSIDFAIFLPIVFTLYWFVFNKSRKYQNVLLLAASYFFYGCWNWKFLSLIILSTLVDFFIGQKLMKTDNGKKRKSLLFTSIAVNLGILIFFKYSNFFIENFTAVFLLFGKELNSFNLRIILPVGISFYTFQTLSYTIDVYRRKMPGTSNLLEFASFVSFFPQLVAGPIERASHLLPQFSQKKQFDYSKATDGMRQILWGLFKKIVIADNCANFVNIIFDNYELYSPPLLIAGAVLFAFQIYGDFSGYSDIAIGTSKLFGFDLMQNFAYPYFSRDIAEFWRRWHISLSTWFRDYLYIPLGGSRGGLYKKIRNTIIIFVVSGFWHGANWTFIFWGGLNALYFLPLLLRQTNRVHTDVAAQNKMIPDIKEFSQIISTFILTTIAWVFFRAPSIKDAFWYIKGMFYYSNKNSLPIQDMKEFILTFIMIIFLLVVEWINRDKKFALSELSENKVLSLRWLSYISIVFIIYFTGNFSEAVEFIYFQF